MGDGGAGKSSAVQEIMSQPVVTAAPSETVVDAAQRMRDHKVGSVVVVEERRPLGIMTERDLVRVAASSVDPAGSKVSEWMTETPEVIEADHDITEAFATFSEHNFRHLPVVSDGQLVGIVSMRDLMRVARIQPVEKPAAEVPRGLEGVAVAETEMGDVRGKQGFYHYRQYNAVDLAEKRTLEDVWYLLYNGELPSKQQRDEFTEEIRPLRAIPASIKDLLPAIASMGDHFIPMDALRSAFSLLGTTEDFRAWLDEGQDALRVQGMRSCALFPTLVMALYRLNKGQEPVDPHPDLPYGANYLYMLRGEEPDPDHARAVEQYLIATIDHGFNASTFT
ncbi:MAG: citrate/2-methylcitrate synthase, partial [Actinomycetota bacterium]